MKNKDGIEIVPGQVWENHIGTTATVIGFDGDKVVVKRKQEYYTQIPDGSVFTTLLKTNDGCDLEESRREGWHVWVPDMQLPEGVVECARWRKTWVACGSEEDPADWSYPRRYKLKPVSPEYQLFEIDWSEHLPRVAKNTDAVVIVGKKIGDYRIFGFTYDANWCAGELYDFLPCDHKGNRKYAIGRLES